MGVIKLKTIKQRFCKSIAENFVISYEDSGINPNKQIFFIVPTKNSNLIEKYKRFFLNSYKIEIVDDEFFDIQYQSVSLLMNLYKMVVQRLLTLSSETDTCFTFLILKFDIMKKLVPALNKKGFKCIVVDATRNQNLLNKLKQLNLEILEINSDEKKRT